MVLEAGFNVRVGGARCRPADAHGRLPLPGGPAAPTGAIPLNTGNDTPCPLIIPECHQDLIEHDLVQNGVTRSAQTFRKTHRIAAGALNEIRPSPDYLSALT